MRWPVTATGTLSPGMDVDTGRVTRDLILDSGAGKEKVNGHSRGASDKPHRGETVEVLMLDDLSGLIPAAAQLMNECLARGVVVDRDDEGDVSGEPRARSGRHRQTADQGPARPGLSKSCAARATAASKAFTMHGPPARL